MNMPSEIRPRPSLTADTEWWWQALEAGELQVQRCEACDLLRHPPEPSCGACGSYEWRGVAVAGGATLHSWVVVHEPALPGFAPPYPVALADLDEGVRMVVGLEGAEPDAIEIGMRLALTVAERGGLALPIARPA
jgi:3-oxo-4,17-pregnadiene-20-carboxyl-CoA hydratase alpha subunit